MGRPLPADAPGGGNPDRRPDAARARHLVSLGAGDPLAPFALRPDKLFVFSPDGRAAVAYKVRLRTAVASGDPIGDPQAWPAAIEAFVSFARGRRWRVAVLGAGERGRGLWAGLGLRAVVIGRDVVVREPDFALAGRKFRNVRQGVQRTRNAGVRVELHREGELDGATVASLREMLRITRKDDTRGFSMILGRLFDGAEPDALIAVAYDARGRIVGAHRYLWAGAHDLSLDLPIRGQDAPNGVDERLVAETVAWGAQRGVERVSLAFAPFPDLFARRGSLGPAGRVAYTLVHLLDPFIRVEALYRYLRKFHAFDQRRYVMLRRRDVPFVLVAMLMLEFSSG